MKKVTRCYECKKLVRYYDTYKVKLDKPELRDGMMVEETRLCQDCTRSAGYKVKADKYIPTTSKKYKSPDESI